MKLIYVIVLAAGLMPAAAYAQEPKTATAPPELSTAIKEHQLKSENWALSKQNAELRAQIADLTARLDSIAINTRVEPLQAERKQLEDMIRATVGAPDDAPIDWSQSPPTVKWTPKTP